MIPVSVGQGFALYFSVWFFVLLILWFIEERRRRKTSDWTVLKEKLYLCSKCQLSFLAQHDTEHITRCPRCNEMCFLKKPKSF